MEADFVKAGEEGITEEAGMKGQAEARPHLDVVRELGQVFDDLAVLCRLHLQQLLDDNHGLCHHQLCQPGSERVGPGW